LVTADANIDIEGQMNIEECCDHLTVVRYDGSASIDVDASHELPDSVFYGDTITWTTDQSVTADGWRICFTESSFSTSSTSSPDGLFTMIGDCDIQGDNCVSSGNYPGLHEHNEECLVTIHEDVQITPGTQFLVERDYDELIINDEMCTLGKTFLCI